MIAGGVNAETYAYTSRGLLRSVSSGTRSIIQNITYRPDGLVENIFYGDRANTKVEHTYDERQRLKTYKVSRVAPPLWFQASTANYTKPDATTTQPTLVSLGFVYDLVGNPRRIDDFTAVAGFDEDSFPVRNRDVVYDDFYRVRHVGYGYGVVDGVATYRPAFKAEVESGDTRPAARRNLPTRPREQQFDYDFMGNTLATSDDQGASYDRSLGNVVNGDGTGWGPNQLVTADGVDARYDEAGNLVELKVSRPGNCPSGMGSRCAQWYAYEWDEVGQLSRARRWDYASTLPAPAGEVPDETPTWDLRYAYSGGIRVLKSATDSSSVERHTLEVFGSLRFERDEYIPGLEDYERHRATTHVYLAGGVGHAFYDDSLPAPSGTLPTRIYLNVGDHLGSTTAVIDHTTSELVERATFMAYGALESDYRPARWSHAREPYKFTGKEEDIEVGATYFGARYYNAHLGRFMSADPLTIHGLASDMNPYAYVRGRVMSHVDPLGLSDTRVQDAAKGAAEAGPPMPTPPPGLPEPNMGGTISGVKVYGPPADAFGDAQAARGAPDPLSGVVAFAMPSSTTSDRTQHQADNSPVKAFDDPYTAAFAASMLYNKWSIDHKTEVAGLIYLYRGGFYYTPAFYLEDDEHNNYSDPMTAWSKVPINALVVGAYHTHGDYVAKDGNEARGSVLKPFSGIRLDYSLAVRLPPFFGIPGAFLSVAAPSGHFSIMNAATIPGSERYVYNAGLLSTPVHASTPIAAAAAGGNLQMTANAAISDPRVLQRTR